VDIYCIAEGAYRVLREYNIPAFGYASEEIPARLAKLHEEIQNGLGRVLHVWRQCGAWDGAPWQEWHEHVPAYRVMRNHNWRAA